MVQIGVNENLNLSDVEQKGWEYVRKQRKTGESKPCSDVNIFPMTTFDCDYQNLFRFRF